MTPLHLTLLGQGVFENSPEVLTAALKKVETIVKGRNVPVFIHGYTVDDVAKAQMGLVAKAPVMTKQEFAQSAPSPPTPAAAHLHPKSPDRPLSVATSAATPAHPQSSAQSSSASSASSSSSSSAAQRPLVNRGPFKLPDQIPSGQWTSTTHEVTYGTGRNEFVQNEPNEGMAPVLMLHSEIAAIRQDQANNDLLHIGFHGFNTTPSANAVYNLLGQQAGGAILENGNTGRRVVVNKKRFEEVVNLNSTLNQKLTEISENDKIKFTDALTQAGRTQRFQTTPNANPYLPGLLQLLRGTQETGVFTPNRIETRYPNLDYTQTLQSIVVKFNTESELNKFIGALPDDKKKAMSQYNQIQTKGYAEARDGTFLFHLDPKVISK